MPRFRGAIFDVDGVLVDSPHEKAWRESLRELMENEWRDIRDQTTWSPEAFTSQVYREYMSGKPRISGASAALEYFKVPDAGAHAAEYADRKQEMVVRLIEAGDFHAYPDALRFVIAVQGRRWLLIVSDGVVVEETLGCSCARSGSTPSPEHWGISYAVRLRLRAVPAGSTRRRLRPATSSAASRISEIFLTAAVRAGRRSWANATAIATVLAAACRRPRPGGMAAIAVARA